MFLGQFRPSPMRPAGMEEPERRESGKEKSSDAESFLKTPQAKSFIKTWSEKTKDGKPLYTKRGVTALLSSLHQVPGLESDKDVLTSAEELLSMLGGMDGLTSFLTRWKAAPEKIIKGLGKLFGGK